MTSSPRRCDRFAGCSSWDFCSWRVRHASSVLISGHPINRVLEGGNVSEGKLDRRGFLAGAAGITGVALSVGAWKPVFAMESASAGHVRDLVPAVQRVGHISFTLDGAPAGFLSFTEGGNATSEVVEQKVEGELITRKHIA